VLAEDNALYLGAPLEQSALRSDGTAPGREGFLNLAGPQGEPLLAIFNPVARERFSGRALFLVGLEHNNFGSFLFRLLPKILLARDLGLKVDLIVVPERMSWSIQALALANFDVPIMSASEAAAFVFDELLLIDEFNRGDPFIDPQSFVRIQALSAQARARHRQSERDRIYVSRRFGSMLFPSYRPLTNEREVESLMAGRGFRIATPEILSLSAQIALFANAQQIVGPSGSGMLNAMFAERGTPVMDIEGYTVVVRQHAKIYGSTGKPYGFVFGTIDQPELGRPQYRPWSVDCVDVARGLDHFASR
jgi:capsular polysaccharide biosynthesis protein